MAIKEYEEKLMELINNELVSDRNPFEKLDAIGRMTIKSISRLQDQTIEKIRHGKNIEEDLAEIEDEYEQLYAIIGIYGGMKDFAGMNYINERYTTAHKLNEMNFDIYVNAYERMQNCKKDSIGVFK